MIYNSRSFAAVDNAGICKICGGDKDMGDCDCPQDVFGSIEDVNVTKKPKKKSCNSLLIG